MYNVCAVGQVRASQSLSLGNQVVQVAPVLMTLCKHTQIKAIFFVL